MTFYGNKKSQEIQKHIYNSFNNFVEELSKDIGYDSFEIKLWILKMLKEETKY